MRKTGWLRLGVAALLLVPPAFAEEIVYFTNGTTLPIRSHRVLGDMVYVDLGDNGFMAFPAFLIENVEGTDGVKLKPSTARPGGKRMVASSRSSAGGAGSQGRGGANNPGRIMSRNPGQTAGAQIPPEKRDPRVMVGGAAYGQGGMSNSQGNGVLRGAQYQGNRFVMDPGTGVVSRRGKMVGVEFSPNAVRPTAPQPGPTPKPQTPTPQPKQTKAE
jgi:hypothetical protein